MKLPCESAVWETLPSIRAAVAKELVDRGLSQKEVSQLLKISPPAVSQYVSKKRGYSIAFSEEVNQAITRLADDMVGSDAFDPTDKICEICRMLREGEEVEVRDECEGCR